MITEQQLLDLGFRPDGPGFFKEIPGKNGLTPLTVAIMNSIEFVGTDKFGGRLTGWIVTLNSVYAGMNNSVPITARGFHEIEDLKRLLEVLGNELS